MNREYQQAQLLEDYMQALRDDIDAIPPEELDPAMAAFARKLTRQRAGGSSVDSKARIWQRALMTIQQQETQTMTTMTYPRNRQNNFSLTAIAAVFVALLFGTLIFAASNLPDPNNASVPAAAQATETEDVPVVTATPAPSLPSSAAPIPATTADTAAYTTVVVAYLPISRGMRIEEMMLIEVLWPADRPLFNAADDKSFVVGQYALTDIPRYMPVLNEAIGPQESGLSESTTFPPTALPPSVMAATSTPMPSPTFTPTLVPSPADVVLCMAQFEDDTPVDIRVEASERANVIVTIGSDVSSDVNVYNIVRDLDGNIWYQVDFEMDFGTVRGWVIQSVLNVEECPSVP